MKDLERDTDDGLFHEWFSELRALVPLVSPDFGERLSSRLEELGDQGRLRPPALDRVGLGLLSHWVNLWTAWWGGRDGSDDEDEG